MASRKTLVHETLTDTIDDQIAQLRNKKTELNRAADALVAADTGVAEARAALKTAEQTLTQRRAEIVALGVKPREISRILKQMRETNGVASPDDTEPDEPNRADDSVSGGEPGPGHPGEIDDHESSHSQSASPAPDVTA